MNENIRSALIDLRETLRQHMDSLDQMSPEEYDAMFRADMAQVRELIQKLGSEEYSQSV